VTAITLKLLWYCHFAGNRAQQHSPQQWFSESGCLPIAVSGAGHLHEAIRITEVPNAIRCSLFLLRTVFKYRADLAEQRTSVNGFSRNAASGINLLLKANQIARNPDIRRERRAFSNSCNLIARRRNQSPTQLIVTPITPNSAKPTMSRVLLTANELIGSRKR